jgi:tRNA-dihydrouridine synthase
MSLAERRFVVEQPKERPHKRFTRLINKVRKCNGDVMNREQGSELAKTYGLDGIMIGRGIFQDPYAFAAASPWETIPREERIALYRDQVERFATTWQAGERNIKTLNKFCKVYISGFDGAKELRERLMAANSTEELLDILR